MRRVVSNTDIRTESWIEGVVGDPELLAIPKLIEDLIHDYARPFTYKELIKRLKDEGRPDLSNLLSEICDELGLEDSASINKPADGYYDMTALGYVTAETYSATHFELVNILFEAGADSVFDPKGQSASPLLNILSSWPKDQMPYNIISTMIAQHLLASKTDYFNDYYETAESIFMCACLRAPAEIVELLILAQTDIGIINVKASAHENSYGFTPLAYAAMTNDVRKMELLNSAGAKIDSDEFLTLDNISDDIIRWTPLVCAAASGSVEAVKWLLDKGAKVDIEVAGLEPNGFSSIPQYTVSEIVFSYQQKMRVLDIIGTENWYREATTQDMAKLALCANLITTKRFQLIQQDQCNPRKRGREGNSTEWESNKRPCNALLFKSKENEKAPLENNQVSP